MGAFKSLTSQDVIITPLVTHKSFTFNGNAAWNSAGIQKSAGANIPVDDEQNIEYGGETVADYQDVTFTQVYRTIKQLYYSNQVPNPEGETIQTDMNGNIIAGGATLNVHSRFNNFLETTLYQPRFIRSGSSSNVDSTSLYVVSIPSTLYGDYINPTSFLCTNIATDNYGTISVRDNGEGGLIIANGAFAGRFVGIINYAHGIAVFPDFIFDESVIGWWLISMNLSFQSSKVIYETQYKCTLRESEFNYSLNPSMFLTKGFISPMNSSTVDTSGIALRFVTGSSFSPYVTSVGLYDDDQQLLAVAKLSQPIPTSRTTDMTIVVNLDR
jgi:hypothetical protein